MIFRRAIVWAALAALALPALAEEKKDEKKDKPTILNASALALLPGTTKTLKLRGLALADTSAVKVTAGDAEVPATIKSKGKSEPPKPFDAPKVGDTELLVELKLPADLKPETKVAITATTPAGVTAPFTISVADPAVTVEEKEPNGGFKTAQALPPGKTLVLGAIESPNDVDVYRVGGKAGERVTVELLAQRRGSPLDGSLTLYDGAGHVLATADDASADARDPTLTYRFAADGVYYLAVIDANDRGSSAHAYVLNIRP